MKIKLDEKVEIPEGITCELIDGLIKCKKGSDELTRKLNIFGVAIKIEGNQVSFTCEKATKRELKMIRTNMAHLRNMFKGIDEKFTYKLKSCNVHFPMILKVEGDMLTINNFLGEKVLRKAKILPNVEINIKGDEITLISIDKEAVGQTAANIEKATRVRKKDRRIFQDGIYIVEKAGVEI